MELRIIDADIKVGVEANEVNVVTLYYSIKSRHGNKGQLGKFWLDIPDVWLARELFDQYKKVSGETSSSI